ncbi:Bug family tripartite tricarboxylate transporter substrate binding protein [Hydrogenophaga sp. BPS33]|uniref:Bug family tripartite tricarboxylate transporter substrate binding protein n=1 Tax=Hydrogenophaga sp. BPS33 TaxID=2651974 RepID=UPI0013200868|nr:tripartite tricarboxylate transporter substrate binding protein [Hydrogenophaga sp. BPS33]QHE85800.1 tripartite tricarboxylate transporter substrate binding protein [Hydrogenophaga sp. BPS33]
MRPSRRQALAAMLALAGASRPWPATAQAVWPSQALRIIVVYPPGGLSDGIARSLAERLVWQLGVPVRVENRGGDGGSVGLQALARAPADGHTLAFSAISPLTLRPHLGPVAYDPLRDIAPVASVMFTPVLLVGTPAFTGRDFSDVLAQARAHPSVLRWATSGVATAGHLVLEQVQWGAGIAVTHVPYKGGGQQLNDALGGQFELLSTNVAPAQLSHVRAGRFKALAVGAPHRLDVLPQVPTFAELGLPQANITSLFGLFAPGGTSLEVLDRLNREINAATHTPAIQERLLNSDNLPAVGDRAAFVRRIHAQWRSNRALKSVRIRLE